MSNNIMLDNVVDIKGVNFRLDDYFRASNLGSLQNAIGNNMYGVNHRQIDNAVPLNNELYGYTFFTRPQLNLRDDNLTLVNELFSLLNANPKSIHRFVRCTLDPRLQLDGVSEGNKIGSGLACPLVDMFMPFIPILGNNLKSLSGFPDMVSPTFDSKPGLKKEVWSIVDGVVEYNESFDIDCTFRTTRGEPILKLMNIWQRYQSAVFEDKCRKYTDLLATNEVDYNTRIYRIITAPDRRTITKIAYTGASFPVGLPIGRSFDYNSETPMNRSNDEISIKFKCMGARYLDDLGVYNFNETVHMYNPEMVDGGMIKIPNNLLPQFNFRGYPYIDTTYNTLDWYLPPEEVEKRLLQFGKPISEVNS